MVLFQCVLYTGDGIQSQFRPLEKERIGTVVEEGRRKDHSIHTSAPHVVSCRRTKAWGQGKDGVV